uniref:Uncharacterized protein n=1 Tax=Avena sativa TaxID=4498 RepID=A0ACD5ZKU5_AVESA
MSSSDMDSLRDTIPGWARPINPLLLASACLGSSGALKFLFTREDANVPPMIIPSQDFLSLLHTASSSSTRILTTQQSSNDVEDGVDHAPALPAQSLLLEGVDTMGNTALHVVATHGESTEFLECAGIISMRDQSLLFLMNQKGETPLHCAARAGKSKMVSLLIDLARSCNRTETLLRTENVLKETALHEAIRVDNEDIVKSLLEADPLLTNYPTEGTSPLYLAVLQGKYRIAEILYDMSNGNLSYKGPNYKNALHASTMQGIGITKLMLTWNNVLTAQQDIDGNTPLHLASSFNRHQSVFLLLFEANPAPVYLSAGKEGLFPIHVAASMGALGIIRIILDKYPTSAGLRTAQGQTFLHVAVEKGRLDIVEFVCGTVSLAWILNMRDNDGNTALYLAVRTRRLRIFCSLYGNKEVHLGLANNRGETPADLSRDLLPLGAHYESSTAKNIYLALQDFGTNQSGLRWDQFETKYSSLELKLIDWDREEEKVKDSSQILGVGSVLIASVAFGATFAVPGGFIADDHTNRGTPTLAGRYTFDAFMMANALAFICSLIATIGITTSGSSMAEMRSRQIHLFASALFISSSLTSLAAAFALGVYMVLAPVAHGTAIVICMFSPLIVLYKFLEDLIKYGILARPFYIRMGLIQTLKRLALRMVYILLIELWPFIFIFGWAAIARSHREH